MWIPSFNKPRIILQYHISKVRKNKWCKLMRAVNIMELAGDAMKN
jgi:hypothetical protein